MEEGLQMAMLLVILHGGQVVHVEDVMEDAEVLVWVVVSVS